MQLEEFRVFPKHVGTWEGHWRRFDEQGQEVGQFTSTITQKIVDNQWVQTNTYYYADGRTQTQEFVGTVTAPGQITIGSLDDPAWAAYETVAEEHGEQLILFYVREKATQALFGLETINLVRPDYRVRTSQRFDPSGEFKGNMVIVERRVEPGVSV